MWENYGIIFCTSSFKDLIYEENEDLFTSVRVLTSTEKTGFHYQRLFILSASREFLVVEDQFPPHMMKMNEFPYRATVKYTFL
jgi:hypothetical protein